MLQPAISFIQYHSKTHFDSIECIVDMEALDQAKLYR